MKPIISPNPPGLSPDERVLKTTLHCLGEVLIETPEAELEAAAGDEAIQAAAHRVRTLLWTTAKTYKQRALSAALEEYRRAVAAMREYTFELPVDPTSRRHLLSSFFQRYPQMNSFTVQHRDFKTMSDADVESFLKQLRALGADLEDPKVKKEDGKER